MTTQRPSLIQEQRAPLRSLENSIIGVFLQGDKGVAITSGFVQSGWNLAFPDPALSRSAHLAESALAKVLMEHLVSYITGVHTPRNSAADFVQLEADIMEKIIDSRPRLRRTFCVSLSITSACAMKPF